MPEEAEEELPLIRGEAPSLDRAIHYWQNKLRTAPNELIAALEEINSNWIDSMTSEPDAARNALKHLESIKGNEVSALEWSEGLNLSAKDHCDDLGPKGLKGHFGTDESSPFDRISRYGKPGWWRGENLTYNPFALPVD